MRTILLIGLGGFLGTVCRYFATSFFSKFLPSIFPHGTFIVNILGCFLIGIIYGVTEHYNWLSPQWRIFLTIGFCGGFTTFSSFAHENFTLLQKSEYFIFTLYSVSSFALGLLAVFAGLSLIKYFSN